MFEQCTPGNENNTPVCIQDIAVYLGERIPMELILFIICDGWPW